MLSAIDIGDAFLTVDQVQPTLVSSGKDTFALGKVLPGQCDGSQLWFEGVSGFLRERLSFKHCDAYPGLLGNEECLSFLHVDDMLVLTKQQYFGTKLMPSLSGKYKISVHSMKQPGDSDSFEFLKRIHTLMDEDAISHSAEPSPF